MSLNLSSKPIEDFYGRVVDTMPVLLTGNGEVKDIPRLAAHIAFIYDQRVNGKEPFRTEFQDNYFWTADLIAKRSRDGEQKFQLSSPLLRELNPQTELNQGAFNMSDDTYDAISGQGVLTLPKEKVARLQGRGYVRAGVSDVFIPATDEVAEIHTFLSRSRIDLGEYAGNVAERTSHRVGSRVDQVMSLYFNQSGQGSATGRSVVVNRAGSNSSVYANDYLDNWYARLAGVAPEALDAFDNAGIRAPTNAEIANLVYAHLGSVDLRKGITLEGIESALRSKR